MEEQFHIMKVIGEGSFGVVMMAKDLKTGEIVAIKKIKEKYQSWDECVNLREVKSLRKLNHQNIIKLKRVLKINDELYLVFEYVDQNIFAMYQEYQKKGENIPEPMIKKIIWQAASGLAYMHKKGFFHRDMKPENLLINSKTVLKIADFGLAREVRSLPPYTSYVSTRWYRSPEILLKQSNYNTPCDIFALGCIMAELYNLVPLFNGQNEIDQLNKIVNVLGTPPKNWRKGHSLAKKIGFSFPKCDPVPLKDIVINASSEAIDLISQMLEYDSSKRPSAAQILKHPYFVKSMKRKPSVWGGTSLRENSLISFKPSLNSQKVFNLQENSLLSRNFEKDDADFELDKEIDEFMEDQKLNQKENIKNSKSKPNLNNISPYKNNGSFMDEKPQFESESQKKWGMKTDEFDVFISDKKPEKKITPPLNYMVGGRDSFGLDSGVNSLNKLKNKNKGSWNSFSKNQSNPFARQPLVANDQGNGWDF